MYEMLNCMFISNYYALINCKIKKYILKTKKPQNIQEYEL